MDLFNSIFENLAALDPGGRIWRSVATIIVIFILRGLLLRAIHSNLKNELLAYRWDKWVRYIALGLIVILVFSIWSESIDSLATYFGLLSAGLAIALSDLIANLAGWVYLITKRQFDVGDRIELGSVHGDVVDIHFLEFMILEVGKDRFAEQNTGRFLHVPNRLLLTTPLANATRHWPFVWHELDIMISYGSDWKHAKTVFLEILNQNAGSVVTAAEKYRKTTQSGLMVRQGKLTPIVYMSVVASGVEMTLRFLVPARRRRGISDRIWNDILERTSHDPKIELAYKTQRLVIRDTEGHVDHLSQAKD